MESTTPVEYEEATMIYGSIIGTLIDAAKRLGLNPNDYDTDEKLLVACKGKLEDACKVNTKAFEESVEIFAPFLERMEKIAEVVLNGRPVNVCRRDRILRNVREAWLDSDERIALGFASGLPLKIGDPLLKLAHQFVLAMVGEGNLEAAIETCRLATGTPIEKQANVLFDLMIRWRTNALDICL